MNKDKFPVRVPEAEILGRETLEEKNKRGAEEFAIAKQKKIEELDKKINVRKKQVQHLERQFDRDKDLLESYKDQLFELEEELGQVMKAEYELELDESTLIENKPGQIIDVEEVVIEDKKRPLLE